MPEVPATHPGEHLGEILDDLNISIPAFAKTLGLDTQRMESIVETREPITADVAVRIGQALDMTPEFWLRLQLRYDIEVESEMDIEIQPISKPVSA